MGQQSDANSIYKVNGCISLVTELVKLIAHVEISSHGSSITVTYDDFLACSSKSVTI